MELHVDNAIRTPRHRWPQLIGGVVLFALMLAGYGWHAGWWLPKRSLPSSFVPTPNLYLGASVAQIRVNTRNLFELSPLTYTIFPLSSPYFLGLSFNVGKVPLLLSPDRIVRISIVGPPTNQTAQADSLLRCVLDTVIERYGRAFTVLEEVHKNDSAISPVLRWAGPGRFVQLFYSPSNLLVGNTKRESGGGIAAYSLHLSYELTPYERTFRQSAQWSPESLGITVKQGTRR